MKYIIAILFTFSFLSCKAQVLEIKDLSNQQGLNYILANILIERTYKKELFKGGQYLTIFQINDSKITPSNYFEGTDEILDSYLISVVPDGDYYPGSKLYKIGGILNPKILEIKEIISPKFIIKIEHGVYDKRKIETFEFEGV